MKTMMMAASRNNKGGFYKSDILADIVHQFRFIGNSRVDEKTKQVMDILTYTGGVISVNDNKMVLNNSQNRYYQLNNSGYFGAGDLTYEVDFILESSISGEGLLLPCQWHNGGISSQNNRFIIMLLPSRAVQVIFSRSGNAGDYVVRSSAIGSVALNTPYKLIVERFNGLFKVFLNGTQILEWSQPAPLWGTTGNLLRGSFNGSAYAAHKWWNLRIAKRALYQHDVSKPVPFLNIA